MAKSNTTKTASTNPFKAATDAINSFSAPAYVPAKGATVESLAMELEQATAALAQWREFIILPFRAVRQTLRARRAAIRAELKIAQYSAVPKKERPAKAPRASKEDANAVVGYTAKTSADGKLWINPVTAAQLAKTPELKKDLLSEKEANAMQEFAKKEQKPAVGKRSKSSQSSPVHTARTAALRKSADSSAKRTR